jgi:hypothetical protein
MTHATGTEILLTSEDVRRWQDELRRLEQSQKETEIRIAELRRKLDGVALIAGATILGASAMSEDSADHMKDETLGEAVIRLLGTFHRPVFHQELKTKLHEIPRFREMLNRNNGAYYYTVIKRLSEDREIKKVAKKRIRLVHKDEAPSEGTPESAPISTAGNSQHPIPGLPFPVNP